jgi:hypothetical protein
MYLRLDLDHDFFPRAKRENITKKENKASLHKWSIDFSSGNSLTSL